MDNARAIMIAERYCEIRDNQFSLYEEYARRHGIGYKNLFVLKALYYAADGCTQMEICQNAFVSKQTVSAIMKDYLKKGYIRFTELPYDRRNKLVLFTEIGKQYADSIIPKLAEAESEAIAQFTEENQKLFVELSAAFTENLKKLMEGK